MWQFAQFVSGGQGLNDGPHGKVHRWKAVFSGPDKLC